MSDLRVLECDLIWKKDLGRYDYVKNDKMISPWVDDLGGPQVQSQGREGDRDTEDGACESLRQKLRSCSSKPRNAWSPEHQKDPQKDLPQSLRREHSPSVTLILDL